MTAPLAPGQGNALLDAALAYAARGWRVFPCVPRDKAPLTPRGFLDASTDRSQIIAWWTKWPTANVAIANGPGSGLVVVDTDGPEGEASLRALLPEVPATPTVSTGKGKHLYFAHPADRIVSRKIRLHDGLDLCGDGGYVVAPPSIHPSGRVYSWLHEGDLEMLPAVLLEPPKDKQPGNTKMLRFPGRVAEGGRETALTSLAGSMRRRGASEDAILAALEQENATRCDPPVSDKDVRRIAGSVSRYEPSADTEPLTEMGNSRRLVALHGHELRYVATWRSWLVWDGRRWERDRDDEVERRARDVVSHLLTQAAAAPDDRRASLAKWAAASSTRRSASATVSFARSEPEIAVTPDGFDADPWALNVLNGTLDLRTGTLRPHDSGDTLSKLAPVEYLPEATCPRWLRFLDEIFAGDQELIAFLQRAIGYTLTGDTREEVLFFAHGSGQNGKTKFFEAIAEMLGDYAKTASFDTFVEQRRQTANASSDLARLHGARLVQASEVAGGRPFDAATLKVAVGGDTMIARRLYQEEFEFRPAFKLWLRANHRPPVREQTLAFWRRMLLIPFAVTIPEDQRDNDLQTKLRAELPGILAWVVQGCLTWQRDGLKPPATVRVATKAYQEECDVLGEFIEARGSLDPGAWTATNELYKAFEAWWGETHARTERVPGRTGFGRLLGERKELTEKKKYAGRGWLGIGLQTDQGDDDDPTPF